jgi:hypothetical protein
MGISKSFFYGAGGKIQFSGKGGLAQYVLSKQTRGTLPRIGKLNPPDYSI